MAEERRSVARSSALMAAGSLVSRITGFGRNVVIGAALGGAAVGDAYTTAQYFPQMIFELVLGGILTSVLVPLLVRARRSDPDGGEAFTHRLLTLAMVLLAAATACVVIGAPLLAQLLTSENRDLVTSLSYLMLPAIFFYGLAALLGAVLNTRERFGAPMWAPIVNNLVVITVGAVFFLRYTDNLASDPQTGDRMSLTVDAVSDDMIVLLGLGTTAGIVCQMFALWPALRRAGFKLRLRFDFGGLNLRHIGSLAGWMFVFIVLNQVAVVAVLRVSNSAAGGGGDAPGPIIYNNGFLMMMMAHGIVAVSIMTALMPRMSSAAQDGNYHDLADHLSTGIRLSTLVLIPITVAYVVLGTPTALFLFNWGDYSVSQAESTGTVIAVAGLVLVPFAVSQLQIYAFYALTQTKIVALINFPVIAFRIGCYLLALAVLPAEHVVAGLMAANGISYLVSLWLSFILLRRRIGLLGMRKVAATVLRLGVAGAAASAVAGLAVFLWPDTTGKVGLFAEIAVVGTLLVACYIGVAMMLRVPEITEAARLLRGKVGRGGPPEGGGGAPAPAAEPERKPLTGRFVDPRGGTIYYTQQPGYDSPTVTQPDYAELAKQQRARRRHRRR